jgi:hypothetical protein
MSIIKTAGLIRTNTGLFDITDPCYDASVSYRLNAVKVKEGSYLSLYTYNEYNNRVEDISIIHSEFTNLSKQEWYDLNNSPWESIGTIGVDAGLAGFFHAPKRDFNDKAWQKFCDELYENNSFTAKVDDYGFYSSTGWGDGAYEVYAKKLDGEIVALKIQFIENDEGEDITKILGGTTED